jgi:hypothetical protein
MQTGEGSVKVERSEPKGNLDGFLARLHDSQQNEGNDSFLVALLEPAIGGYWEIWGANWPRLDWLG